MARILGLGGVFFKARDPKALADWYRDMLDFPVEEWGGAAFELDAARDGRGQVIWSPFPADTKYFDPSDAAFMINLRVDDLDGLLLRLAAKGVQATGREDSEYGRFAWILDPEGRKLELWEPPLPAGGDRST